jgi:polyhydroxyalkanoate synthase subunit PhaC
MELRPLVQPFLEATGGPELAPTPRSTIATDATARLIRFLPAAGTEQDSAAPVLLIPSLINRWYVLDLRQGFSLAEALLEKGHDVYLLDWGTPEDEDRYLSWDDVIARLRRAIVAVRRATGARRVSLLGYCIGGTLAGIATALHPELVAALVNLAGPFDFAHAGMLADFSDARWFDAGALASAGNVTGAQLQSGFVALRPTAQLAKWIGFAERAHDPEARAAFLALETWANDNVAFPAAAYATYIESLYQRNELVAGRHYVAGRAVGLRAIRCPVLTIVAERDTICPPRAATALNDLCGAQTKDVLEASGGHVGAVIGSRASRVLYPHVAAWLHQHTTKETHRD